jgi:hypothetical protein
MRGSSKREHCPGCKGIAMTNYVHVEAGSDMEVFVECVKCGAFVSRYTLKIYTGDDPYRSFLRLMHQRRMDTGAAAQDAISSFKEQLKTDYEKVKKEVEQGEETRKLEDVLSECSED